MSPFMLLSLLLTGILVCFAVPSEAVGGRLGGLEPAYADEDGVIRAAHFATAELDKMSNALYASKLTDIKSAEKQVVQGMNYYLTIELTQTKCKHTHGPVKNLDSCDIMDNTERQLCTVKVNEFMSKSKLLEYSCKKA